MQIHENSHVERVTRPQKGGRVRIFFCNRARQSKKNRDSAVLRLRKLAREMTDTVTFAKEKLKEDNLSPSVKKDAEETSLAWELSDPSVKLIDDYKPSIFGLEVPMRVLWEGMYVRQDISRSKGSEFDTGRPSRPNFQDDNIATLLKEPKDGLPRPVLYQMTDDSNALNPFNLLMAYEENSRVLPVVSDFDCFVLGSKGLKYDQPLSAENLDVMKQGISGIEDILSDKSNKESWVVQWIDLKKRKKFNPTIPKFGFGDPVSYDVMGNACDRLIRNGAVRHGSESFNYGFPQDLDEDFLVISNSDGVLSGKQKWQKMSADEVRDFLDKQIDNGYTFPLNPRWVLAEKGWKKLYDKFLNSTDPLVKMAYDVWYPEANGIREQMRSVSEKFPNGFVRRE